MKVVLYFSFLFLMSCTLQSRLSRNVETDKLKGIICTDARQWGFKEFWIPTEEQVRDAEAAIERFLEENPPEESPDLRQRLGHYKRQYVGHIVNAQKLIFCNFYCDDPYPSDSTGCSPKLVEDGGDCYFQIDYDVDWGKVVRLAINYAP